MPGKKATYGIFNWGPCVLKIKISEEFHKLLLKEANESRKEENLYQDKLAGTNPLIRLLHKGDF